MRARLLAATAALLVTTACGGEPSPAPAPYKGPTSTPSSASPTAVPRTAESATDFIATYMEAFTRATITGEVQELDKLSSSDCLSCKTLRKNIRGLYAAGGSASGGGFVAKNFKLKSGVTTNPVVLEGVVQFEPQTEIASPGARPKVTKGGPAPSRITLQWVKGTWLMGNWEFR